MPAIMRHLSGGLGHLLLLSVFVLFSVWYALDAYMAQQKVENLLLIWPAAIIVLVLAVGLAAAQARAMMQTRAAHAHGDAETQVEDDAEDAQVDGDEPAPQAPSFQARYGTPLSAIGLGLYVLSLPFLGFDVATALFVAASMRLQGERNPVVICLFAVMVATLPILGIEYMLSVPVPTVVLP